jgi:hypothetical protein
MEVCVFSIPCAVAKLRPISAIRLGVTKNQDSSASELFGFVVAVILFQICPLFTEIDFENETSSVRPSWAYRRLRVSCISDLNKRRSCPTA